MIGTLIKKQLAELLSSLVKNRKSERKTGKNSLVLIVVLLVAVYLIFGFAIYMLTELFFVFEEAGAQSVAWLFFSFFGILAFILGLVGSVFMTYQTLYGAKDNDLLLSLPIKPSLILLSRSVGLYIFTLAFEAVVLIPAEVRYIVQFGFSPLQALLALVSLFLLPLFTFVFSALFGYIVALIAPKIKRKSMVTVIMSAIFIALYFVVYMRFRVIMQELITHADRAEPIIKYSLFPFYALGRGLSGGYLLFGAFVLISLASFALVYLLLSRSFFKLATTPAQTVRRVYDGRVGEQKSVGTALLKKEIACFLNCPSYILNTMIGVVMLVVAAVAQFFLRSAIKETIGSAAVFGVPVLPLLIVGGVGLFGSMGCTTSPSISLEGQSLPLLRSLPVSARSVLHAKMKMHLLLIVLPTWVSNVAICLSLIDGVPTALLASITPLPLFLLTGLFGLIFNLKHPFLDWSSEVVAIKQSGSTVLTLLSSLFAMLLGVGAAIGALLLFESAEAALLSMFAVFTALTVLFAVLLEKWGVKRFDTL